MVCGQTGATSSIQNADVDNDRLLFCVVFSWKKVKAAKKVHTGSSPFITFASFHSLTKSITHPNKCSSFADNSSYLFCTFLRSDDVH